MSTKDVVGVIFQSTFPLRGTTAVQRQPLAGHEISIHVPLAGNDPAAARKVGKMGYFNPRSPCGERLLIEMEDDHHGTISIHVPLAGNDRTQILRC